MTLDPGATQSAVQSMVTHLYDEIRDMRADLAGARSDVRNLATTTQAALTQVGDHETRLRPFENGTAPVLVEMNAEIDSLRRDQRSTSRSVWIGTGIAMATSVALPIVISVMMAKH